MTTFKPKMFKSQNGCVICRAKSSSSRFTASDRYSPSFSGCFQIEDERQGDICNACVLIVKRWNKLPASDNKNWAHVVDARLGPGMKVVARPKKKDEDVECLKYKHKYVRKGGTNVAKVKINRSRSNSEGSNRSVSPSISEKTGSTEPTESLYPDFLDPHYWRRTTVCCGILFIGQLGEVMMDRRFYKKCSGSVDCQTLGGARKEVAGSESGENDSEIETAEFFPVNSSEKDKLQKDDPIVESTDQHLASSDLETFSCVSN